MRSLLLFTILDVFTIPFHSNSFYYHKPSQQWPYFRLPPSFPEVSRTASVAVPQIIPFDGVFYQPDRFRLILPKPWLLRKELRYDFFHLYIAALSDCSLWDVIGIHLVVTVFENLCVDCLRRNAKLSWTRTSNTFVLGNFFCSFRLNI